MVTGSSYLGSAPKRALGRPRRFGTLAALFLIFSVLLSTFATLPLLDALTKSSGSGSSGGISTASALWCSDPKEGNLGLGMNNQSNWNSGSARYVHDDTTGRILTAQEAFGNGIRFTNFNGVGEPQGVPWFVSAPLGLPQKDDDKDENLKSVVSYTGNTPDGAGTENWYKNMNGSRSASKCVMGNIGSFVANGVLGITGGVTNLMGGISSFAFDPHFICDPDDPKGNCIDLVGIIGGGGQSDQGIIGKLTSSVYFPLLSLAALLVGVYIVWNGIAKRQFRETFLGVLWSVIVTILGIAFLLNPLMLAKAPMVAGNALTSCIVGAFTGSGGCADNSGGSGTSDPQTAICEAWSSKTDFVDKAAITMTSMSCQLWKAFVLQPYAQGSFGATLDQLDLSKSDTIGSKILAKNPGFDSKTFCVDTKVKGKLDSHYSNTLDLTTSGTQICNLAVYQAYLGVDAKMDSGAGGNPPAAGAIDGRWLKVAQLAASDEGMYRAWAPNDMHLSQISLALIGLFSAVLAAIVIFVVAAFALAFYVTSILMIAFAPFFLLAGVHPGKGRKMMIGWIGQVLSNVMKYAASAIFLVITVSLYSAVLANVSNPGAILIFMIILTVALLMYRREIVDMVGVIDLGGEKLSNRFAQATMDRVRNTGKTATAVGAGVTAGALSNGALNPFRVSNYNPKNMLRNFGDSARAGNDAFRRSVKGRPGAMGELMKAGDRISSDNRADMGRQFQAANDEANRADKAATQNERELKDLGTELDTSRTNTRVRTEELNAQESKADRRLFRDQDRVEKVENAQNVALDAISNPVFREYQDLLNQIKDLELKAVIEEAGGNGEAAAQLRSQATDLGTQSNSLLESLGEEQRTAGRNEYEAALAATIEDPRVNPNNAISYTDHVRKEYQNTMQSKISAVVERSAIQERAANLETDLGSKLVDTEAELRENNLDRDRKRRAADEARQRVIDLKPGDVVTNIDARKNERMIRERQNDQSSKVQDLSADLNRQIDEQKPAVQKRDDFMRTAQTSALESKKAVEDANRARVAQRDLAGSQRSVAGNWKNTSGDDAQARARKAFAERLEAEAEATLAAGRIKNLSDKPADELSEGERNRLISEKQREIEARAKMTEKEQVIQTSGIDMGRIREAFQKQVEDSFSKTNSGQSRKIQGGLEEFQKALKDEADAAVKRAQEENRKLEEAHRGVEESTEDAAKAELEIDVLKEAAKRIQKPASGSRPVSERRVAKINRATEDRVANGRVERGLPVPLTDERNSVPQAEQPQDAQAPSDPSTADDGIFKSSPLGKRNSNTD